MQAAQTEELPPYQGKRTLAIIGWIRKSKKAPSTITAV
jgi:hypothetical protein